MVGRLTILLIEDNEDDAKLLARSLERSGFRDHLQVLSNAEAAIEYLKGTAGYSDRKEFPIPVFIILDLTLPGMSGLEFLTWTRENPLLAQMPVIVLSASPYDADVRKAYELGAKTFFTKPLAGEDLDTVVKLIVGYWSASRLPAAGQPSQGRGL
jgi:CheY-like chemotaxis protein